MKAVALALALLAVPVVAQAATHHRHRSASHAYRATYSAPQREIACSQLGCAPVPPGCRRGAGRTLNGTPTGFDIADCGSYTLYGNR